MTASRANVLSLVASGTRCALLTYNGYLPDPSGGIYQAGNARLIHLDSSGDCTKVDGDGRGGSGGGGIAGTDGVGGRGSGDAGGLAGTGAIAGAGGVVATAGASGRGGHPGGVAGIAGLGGTSGDGGKGAAGAPAPGDASTDQTDHREGGCGYALVDRSPSVTDGVLLLALSFGLGARKRRIRMSEAHAARDDS